VKYDENNISGGIVPHHEIAWEMMGEFYQSISTDRQLNVFIIGPNHFGMGTSFCQIGTEDFVSFGNRLEINREITEILELQGLRVSNQLQGREHSIGIHTPLIKHYLPNSVLVPTYIKGNGTLDDMSDLTKMISEVAEEGDVFIFSIDFSHYLSLEEAMEKDQVTKALIDHGDVEMILGLGNDYVDSPTGLGVFLKLAEALDKSFVFTGHGNSAEILGRDDGKSTSYFTVLFMDKEIE